MLLEALQPTTASGAPGFFVAAGFVLIVIAIVWRAVLLSWTARRLRLALEDPDPAGRAAAVGVATAQGLTRHAGALLSLVRTETDESVLDVVSDAVKRHIWEPGDNRKVVELRLWADRWARDGSAAPAPAQIPTPALTPPPAVVASSDDDTPRVCVMVTGAGGPAGVSVIRALRAAGHCVVGADADPLAAGFHLAHGSAVVPSADDPAFVEALLEAATAKGADALVCTIAEEMLALSDSAGEIARHVAIWLPPRDALETTLDKWQFACAMREAGVRIPPTALGTADGVPGPWIVKPRAARGSRGVHVVDVAEDVEAALRAAPGSIVQTRLQGNEFTVDALVDRSGELLGAVPRWRLETKAGISTKGQTFSDDRVLMGVANVLSSLRFQGAANVQGFVDSSDVWFVEVNPRFSGGLPLSLRAGADLVGEYLRGVLGLPMRSERLGYETGTRMIRHFEEVYA